MFSVFADWAFSKKQKVKLAEDLASIKEHKKQLRARSETDSQQSRKT